MDRSCCIRCIVVKDINLVKATAASGEGQLFEEFLAKAKEDTEQNTERITKTVHCSPEATCKQGYVLSCSIPLDTTAIEIFVDCYVEAYIWAHRLSFAYPSGEIFNVSFTPTHKRSRYMCKLDRFNGDIPIKLWYFLPDELRYEYDEKSYCVTVTEETVPGAAGEPEDADR